MTVLFALKDMNPDWLTDALREKGVLETGRVSSVKSTSTNHQSSLIYFLNINYTADAPETAPKTLFLKLSRPERLPLTAGEVEYYTKILAQMPHKITPICYAAEFDSEKGAYHILMEDVSETHIGLSLAYPPTLDHALKMAKTLARLHAFWWEKPDLNTVSDLPTEPVIQRFVQKCLPGLPVMFDFLGDRITTEQKRLIENLTEQWPRWMSARTQQTPNHLTLLHGDSHNANFLLPKNGGETYLIDRQPFDWSLTCWLGVKDLTYMMVQFWYPTYRHRVEETVLRTYHAELLTHGVKNYTWEQLWQDYRLCAIQSLYGPLAWCTYDLVEDTAWIWNTQLNYTLDAIQQLDAEKLLKSVL
jgi:hypothetical protein